MSHVTKLVNVAGWSRIIFGWLTIAFGISQHPQPKSSTETAILLLQLWLAYFIGVFGGKKIREAAKLIEERKRFNYSILILTFFGVIAFCDCGWIFSAPICLYAIVRLFMIRNEFE